MSEKNTIITEEKLDKYSKLSKTALLKAKPVKGLILESLKVAEIYLDMAKRYIGDADHFREKGMYVEAYGALNYAHAWLDAGAIIGIFDVDGDNILFTQDASEHKHLRK